MTLIATECVCDVRIASHYVKAPVSRGFGWRCEGNGGMRKEQEVGRQEIHPRAQQDSQAEFDCPKTDH